MANREQRQVRLLLLHAGRRAGRDQIANARPESPGSAIYHASEIKPMTTTTVSMDSALQSVRDIFFFGAGASHGSADCIPALPPLGTQVFKALRDKRGIAATVTGHLKALFEDCFEAGMAEFAATRETDVVEFLRDMAAFFAEYEPGSKNEYFKLVRQIQRKEISPTFVTLNYELLLEYAIQRSGIGVQYGGAPSRPNCWPVLKIHGSCNFLPDTSESLLRDIRLTGFPNEMFHFPAKIAGSKAEILEFCRREDSLAPSIAIYAPGKRVLVNEYVIQHDRQVWKQLAGAARRIFVIGVSVNPADEHIWNTFASCRQADLFYVGHEPEVFLRWAADNQRRCAYVLATDFSEAIPLIQ